MLKLFRSLRDKVILRLFITHLLLFCCTEYANGNEMLGRAKEIKALQGKLLQENFITITGMSGIGKTTVAREYARLNDNKYDIIWWFEEENDFEYKFINLGFYLGDKYNKEIVNQNYPNKVNLKRLRQYLEKTQYRILFVFDNFFSVEDILKYIPHKSNFTYMVTSLNSFNNGSIVRIKEMPRISAKKIIQNKVNCTDGEADRLAEALEDHPLAILQAVTYINTRPTMTIDKYLEFYKNFSKELWAKEETLKIDKTLSKTVYSSILMGLDNLQKKNFQAYELLKYFSITNKNIPDTVLRRIYLKNIENNELSFFEALAALKKFSLIEGSKTSKIEAVEEMLSREYFTAGKDKLSGVENTALVSKHLAIKSKEIRLQDRKESFSCHDLIFKALRAKLSQREYKAVLENTIQEWNLILPSLIEEYKYPLLLKKIDVRGCVNSLIKEGIQNKITKDFDILLLKIFEYLVCISKDYKEAIYIRNIIEEYYSINNADAINKAYFYSLKGAYHSWKEMDPNKSKQECEKALKILDKYPKAGEYKVFPMLLIAQNYYDAGELEIARKYTTEAIEVVLKSENGIVSQGARLRFTMAQISASEGEYNEALHYLEQGYRLSILEDSKIINPYYIRSMVLYAEILKRLGQEKRAYRFLHRAYTTFEEVIGTKEHEKYVALCVALADICGGKKELTEMKMFIDEAKNYMVKVNINDSLLFAKLYKIEGDYHFAIKAYEKAENNYAEAEGAYTKVFTSLKHDDIRRLITQQALTYVKLKKSEEYGRCVKTYTEIFGRDEGLKMIISFIT